MRVGSSESGEVATEVQYVIMSERDCQDGKRTLLANWSQDEDGMGVLVLGRGEEIEDVEDGEKGELVDGVRRALRWVEIVSSIEARERRRKSRSARSLKQNCGVSEGGGYGCAIMSPLCGRGRRLSCGGGGGGFALGSGDVLGGGVGGEEAFQNHASLNGVYGLERMEGYWNAQRFQGFLILPSTAGGRSCRYVVDSLLLIWKMRFQRT